MRHWKLIASTADLIFSTITSASSVPCLPLNPFIAATIPTIDGSLTALAFRKSAERPKALMRRGVQIADQ